MGKPEIHHTDMCEELQKEALQFACWALIKYKDHAGDIACYIVKEFEKKQGGYWNCIVGDCEGYLYRQENCYIRFSIGDKIFTVFRSA